MKVNVDYEIQKYLDEQFARMESEAYIFESEDVATKEYMEEEEDDLFYWEQYQEFN